jgi:hypothetical protein
MDSNHRIWRDRGQGEGACAEELTDDQAPRRRLYSAFFYQYNISEEAHQGRNRMADEGGQADTWKPAILPGRREIRTMGS